MTKVVKVSTELNFKFPVILTFLDLNRPGIVSPSYKQKVLYFFNFERLGKEAQRAAHGQTMSSKNQGERMSFPYPPRSSFKDQGWTLGSSECWSKFLNWSDLLWIINHVALNYQNASLTPGQERKAATPVMLGDTREAVFSLKTQLEFLQVSIPELHIWQGALFSNCFFSAFLPIPKFPWGQYLPIIHSVLLLDLPKLKHKQWLEDNNL